MSNELVVFTPKQIVALDSSNPQVEALMFNLQASGGINASDLTKVKNPSGGATVFEIAAPGQPTKYEPKIRGVILYLAGRRTLWADKTPGSGELPVCSSNDMERGSPRVTDDGQLNIPEELLELGMPGGDDGKCASCYFNEWGTAINDKGKPTRGKRCQESKVMFFLPIDQALPIKFTVPSGSLKDFGGALMRMPVRYDRAVVDLSLVKDKSAGGTDFAKYVVSYVAPLDTDSVDSLGRYMKLLEKAFKSATAERQTDGKKKREDEIPADQRM
jgi:hypothetical protein